MMGHCGVVRFQRRSVSSCGSSTTPARPRSIFSLPSSTKIRDQTISPGLEMPLSDAAAQAEVHRRLPFAGGAGPAADEMGRRNRAADQEHPDVVLHRARLVPVAPADVVQGVFDRLAHRLVDAVGHQAVQAGALVDFVEMQHRLALEEDSLAVAAFDRRAVGVVERAFDQIAGRQQVLQPLLILDADHVAAEIVGDPHGGDVHLALHENLVVGQIGFLVRAGDELHAALFHPLADGPGFVVADLRGLVIQGRLAEPFLVHAQRIEQFVLDDGVVHAHAAFVEDAHDGFFAARVVRPGPCRVCFGAGDLDFLQRRDVLGRMLDFALVEPSVQVRRRRTRR